jgi:hypothetical protein
MKAAMCAGQTDGGNNESSDTNQAFAHDPGRADSPAAKDFSGLPDLAKGSPELRAAHFNLTNIRRALAGAPGLGLRP